MHCFFVKSKYRWLQHWNRSALHNCQREIIIILYKVGLFIASELLAAILNCYTKNQWERERYVKATDRLPSSSNWLHCALGTKVSVSPSLSLRGSYYYSFHMEISASHKQYIYYRLNFLLLSISVNLPQYRCLFSIYELTKIKQIEFTLSLVHNHLFCMLFEQIIPANRWFSGFNGTWFKWLLISV